MKQLRLHLWVRVYRISWMSSPQHVCTKHNDGFGIQQSLPQPCQRPIKYTSKSKTAVVSFAIFTPTRLLVVSRTVSIQLCWVQAAYLYNKFHVQKVVAILLQSSDVKVGLQKWESRLYNAIGHTHYSTC